MCYIPYSTLQEVFHIFGISTFLNSLWISPYLILHVVLGNCPICKNKVNITVFGYSNGKHFTGDTIILYISWVINYIFVFWRPETANLCNHPKHTSRKTQLLLTDRLSQVSCHCMICLVHSHKLVMLSLQFMRRLTCKGKTTTAQVSTALVCICQRADREVIILSRWLSKQNLFWITHLSLGHSGHFFFFSCFLFCFQLSKLDTWSCFTITTRNRQRELFSPTQFLT